MRMILLLIDLLIPFLILSIIYVGLKSIFRKKVNPIEPYKMASDRHSIEFKNFLVDWNNFIQNFYFELPAEAQKSLVKITYCLETLIKKSQYESFDGKTRPQSIYQLSDILYKHVPEITIEYLKLPQHLTIQSNSQGKTPHNLLVENLNILANGVQQITDGLFESNLHNMRVQDAHIKTKFEEKEI